MKVIAISYGRQLFVPKNIERERLVICAEQVESFDMIVFTSKSDNQQYTKVTEKFNLHPTNSKTKFHMVFDAYKIAKLMIKEKQDDIIVTTQDPFEAGLVGYLLKKRFNKIHLNVQEHADAFSEKFWRNETFGNSLRFIIGKYIIRRADTIRVVSDRIRKTIANLNIRGNITQLPVAIDVDKFVSAEADETSRHFPRETFQFLSVARFVPQKNFSLMIKSFASAFEKNSSIRLLIVGQGPEEEKIHEEILRHFSKLIANEIPIKIIDWSDDVPALMKQSNAYLLSSNYEGWARVLIEAVCSDLPLVTTDVGCAGEVIRDGEYGYVTALNNVKELTSAIVKISTNNAEYERFTANLKSLDKNSLPGVGVKEYGERWVRSLV